MNSSSFGVPVPSKISKLKLGKGSEENAKVGGGLWQAHFKGLTADVLDTRGAYPHLQPFALLFVKLLFLECLVFPAHSHVTSVDSQDRYMCFGIGWNKHCLISDSRTGLHTEDGECLIEKESLCMHLFMQSSILALWDTHIRIG